MHHVAIMNPAWRLIPKILSGEKTIESRWYQTRRAPWDRIRTGDVIYFKDAGKQVSVLADVSDVMQFELESIADAEKIVEQYGKEICMVETDPRDWNNLPKYCILVRLRNPIALTETFTIDRTGFGSGTAWITVPDIDIIKQTHEHNTSLHRRAELSGPDPEHSSAQRRARR